MNITAYCVKRGGDASLPYSNYRIPGIAVTDAGTVLIWFEARRTASDWAMMDILLYRSEDGGRTFGEPICIAKGDAGCPTVNNPVCIVGQNGVLHFLFCKDYGIRKGGVFYRRSADDGLTWSEARNITPATRPDFRNVIATGPCHGLCTRSGMLLTPVWMVPKTAGEAEYSHHPAVVSTLYSRDGGDSWQMGEILPPVPGCPDPNETVAAELADGRIYLNIRSGGAKCRLRAYSGTGYESWTPLERDEGMPDPTCCGSVITAEYGGRQVLLAVNCNSVKARENLTCRASFDGGQSWAVSAVIDPAGVGYSDIAVTPDGEVLILYEKDAGKEDWMARFDLAEMLG